MKPDLPPGYYPCPTCGFISIRDGLSCPQCKHNSAVERRDSTTSSNLTGKHQTASTQQRPMGVLTWLFNLFKRRSASPREYAIFVSYSRRDGDIVTPLVQMLRLSGTGVFRDLDHIRPGTKWRTVLIDAVDSCELVLLFWCHHSAGSAEVRKEYTQALQGGKLLTPVLLDDTPLSTTLSEYQAIDMRGLFRHEVPRLARSDVCYSMRELTPDEKRQVRHEERARFDDASRRLMVGIGARLGVLESRKHAGKVDAVP